MKYQPNFNDKRVIQRIRHAYGFARGVMACDKPSGWSQSVIDKYFGQHQTDLSKYLRGLILICTNHSYDIQQGISKEYILNEIGMRYLKEMMTGETTLIYHEWINKRDICEMKSPQRDDQTLIINAIPNNTLVYNISNSGHLFDQQLVSEWCFREYGQELKSLNFTYDDKSSRLWHPLQSVKREFKKHVFTEAGMKYQYDIQCCAPTLILQHAQQLGMDEYLFTINEYINNRDACRKELSELADIPVSTAKVIVNALFCGARLGNNKEFALSRLLNHDSARIIVLQESKFITQLKQDIKTCWETIETTMTQVFVHKPNGTQRKRPTSSKQKWNRYFQQERKVLDAIRMYLNSTNNKHFCEHDGWNCVKEVNEQELIEHVKKVTGYSIRL